jgi:predicted nucleic acid-binding protein
VLLLRRKPPVDTAPVLAAARAEISAGAAAIASATVSELLIGERNAAGVEKLWAVLARLPAVPASDEVGWRAGTMGAFLALRGASVPFPDLFIAATALWLEIPLLTWDGDFARARRVAVDSRSTHPGAELWRKLELHSASRTS